MQTKRSPSFQGSVPTRAAAGGVGGFVEIQAPRSFLLFAGLLFLLLGVVIGVGAFWAGRHFGSTRIPGDLPRATVLPLENGSATFAAKAGPWGDLECQRTFLEVPEEYLGTRAFESDAPHWFFKGFSTNTLQQLFEKAALPDAAAGELMDVRRWRLGQGGIWVTPSMGVVLSLSPAIRRQIYDVLGSFPENILQNQPFHWPEREIANWMAGAELSRETQTLFEKLCYQRGDALLFSDPAVLLSALPNQIDKNRFGKALMRRPVVFASLKVTPQSDIEALVRYWGAGGGGKDLRPLLEAAARIPGGRKISMAALLPPQVRGRLYTFPFQAPDAHLNCHWTSFNFFKKNPDPPTDDTTVWKKKLAAEYQPVSDSPRYGDLLVLTSPDGGMIHSCVYLADDLVYTKNGASPLAPWQVSTIPDVLEFYSWDLPANSALRKTYFRKL